MVILLLTGLTWPILVINCQSVDHDPEAAAIGDEMSPEYYRRTAIRMPVIVLGEPIRVRGTERNVLGPGFVFGEDYEVEDGERYEEGEYFERDEEEEYYRGDEDGEYFKGDDERDEGEQQYSLPSPPPGINIRQV